MRSPEAVARWAWPIHMPSIRSGATSMFRSRLNGEERAEAERAGDDHVARRRAAPRAWASIGRKESSGTYTARWRFARTVCAEDVVRAPLEARLPPLLLRERLDDVDADDRLLGDRRDVGEALLDVAQHRVRHGRVAVGDGDERRRDRERDQGEPPVDRRTAPP